MAIIIYIPYLGISESVKMIQLQKAIPLHVLLLTFISILPFLLCTVLLQGA